MTELESLESNLASICSQEEPSNKDIMSAILQAQAITCEKLKPLDAALKQITANKGEIKVIKSKMDTMAADQLVLHDKVAFLEQAKLECHATITGFQLAPDSNALKETLCTLAAIDPTAVLDVRSFTLKSFTPPRVITNVIFANAHAKGKLMKAKMDIGTMTAVNFFPSMMDVDGARNQIYIGHKLTRSNLTLRKELKELKQAKKIHSFRFRNNRYQLQFSAEDKWQDVQGSITLRNLMATLHAI